MTNAIVLPRPLNADLDFPSKSDCLYGRNAAARSKSQSTNSIEMELILVLVAIIGLVWTAVFFRRSSLLTSCTVLMIVGSCLGHAFFHRNVGPLPLTIDRLLWFGIVLQFLYMHRVNLDDPKPISRIDLMFAAYIVYLGLNTMLTDWQINGKAPLAHWLFSYLMPAAVYWISRQAKIGEREFRWFTMLMTAFGLYLAITAFAETRQWWWMVFPKHIASTEASEFLGRGRGPFMNPVSCGIFQVFGFCCMLMWWPRVGTRGKVVLMLLSGIFSVGVFCTLTRSIWITFALALGLIVWLLTTYRTRGILISSAVACGVIGLAVTGGELNSFKRDVNVTEVQMSESAKLRPMLAAVALEMAADKPIFGFGLAQYKQNSAPYHFTDRWEMPLRTVSIYVQHNMFLASLVETGLFGLTLLVGLIAVWTWLGWKLWRSRNLPLWVRQTGLLQILLIIAFTVNGMFHDTLLVPMGTSILFLMAGITSGVAARNLTAASPVQAANHTPAKARFVTSQAAN